MSIEDHKWSDSDVKLVHTDNWAVINGDSTPENYIVLRGMPSQEVAISKADAIAIMRHFYHKSNQHDRTKDINEIRGQVLVKDKTWNQENAKAKVGL